MLGHFSNNQSSPKFQIIEILGNEFPLTPMKVYNIAKKRYQCDRKYVTFFKHMSDLFNSGILIKNSQTKEYHISPKWIEFTKTSIESIRASYSHMIPVTLKDAKLEGVDSFSFNSLEDFYKSLSQFKKEFIENCDSNEENVICCLSTHIWRSLLYVKDYSQIRKKMKEKNIKYYLLVRGNTALDRMATSMFDKYDFDVKMGINDCTNITFGIYNNVMLCLFYPPKMLKIIDDFFNKNKTIEEANFDDLFNDLFGKKLDLKLVIIRNKNIVESYKKYVISFFEENKL
jgi:hypothetical protein